MGHWVYLQSLLLSNLKNKLYCIRWCVTVVQDHRNWHQLKAHMRLPISLPL